MTTLWPLCNVSVCHRGNLGMPTTYMLGGQFTGGQVLEVGK